MALDPIFEQNELYQFMLQMKFTVKDAHGNPQVVSPDPSNNNLQAFAGAIVQWAIPMLTERAKIIVNAGQPVQVDPTSGSGATLPQGSGSIL